MSLREKRAFTLIELLIVVAIIAILAAIAIPNFLEAQIRARVSQTISDMRTVAGGILAYQVDNHAIPWARGAGVAGGGTWIIDFILLEGARLPHLGTLITTPVAYLPTCPYDYFNTNMSSFTRGQWSVSNYPRIGATFSGPPYSSRQSSLEIGNWFLESVGPDRVWHNDPGNKEWYYNPTNGTISNGQVVYYSTGEVIPGTKIKA